MLCDFTNLEWHHYVANQREEEKGDNLIPTGNHPEKDEASSIRHHRRRSKGNDAFVRRKKRERFFDSNGVCHAGLPVLPQPPPSLFRSEGERGEPAHLLSASGTGRRRFLQVPGALPKSAQESFLPEEKKRDKENSPRRIISREQ